MKLVANVLNLLLWFLIPIQSTLVILLAHTLFVYMDDETGGIYLNVLSLLSVIILSIILFVIVYGIVKDVKERRNNGRSHY